MRFLTVSALAALAPALVSASAIENFQQNNKRHHHNIHKRQAIPEVQTVYQTQVNVQTVNQVVTVTGGDDSAPATSTEASAETTTVVPSSAADAAASPVQSAVTETASAISSVAADAWSAVATSDSGSSVASASATSSESSEASSSAASSSSSSPSSSSSSDSSLGDAGALGITYSPYTNSGSCKSASQVKADIKKLSGFKIIRLYSVDCSGVENVLAAIGDNQKLFAGLYHLNSIEDDVSTLASAIKSSGKSWDIVDTVSVGNELVNSGEATTSQIKDGINTAKSALKNAGYTGNVVSVDTFTAVKNNKDLCEYSDYVAVNCHPYFDGGVTAEKAGEWLLEQIQSVYTACGSNKNVLITETGWPHSGDSNGEAVPSEENQKKAIEAIKEKTGASVFLFTVYNDLWKSPGALNVEQSWGLYGNTD